MILPEIVAVGVYNSEIASKNNIISKKRKASMFEIELPADSGGISYIDTEQRQISSDMVICAKPGQFRHTKFPYNCYFVHMIVQDELLYQKLMTTSSFLTTSKSSEYKDIFERMIRYYNTPSDNDEIILHSLILKLIYLICKESDRRISSERPANNSHIIEKSIGYIKEHLTDDLSLENVARAMSLSPIHFHNTFRDSVGKTLRDYIEEQRIKKAINLLLTTNYSLTKIAYECGFSSQSYFSYVFKRRMKTTPREYVKSIYNKYEI